ncbi:MAG TPA: hypothetical protein VFY78_05075 [Gammaproteobacteria bacterium]|nr:hypothetical protein [Gammaproteobacteria bacterium]
MKTLLATLALALSFAAAPVMAAENPFSMGTTAQIQTADAKDGKCGDSMKKETGKCGDAMKKCMESKTKEECAKEGKCGEGKCGDGAKKKEGKCGEGKCGEGMKK